ncbi:MAG: phosphoribosylanthranilate isomerase [Deltaproteobacteria bacterium]|nr:phosphoribosylanthranilate isomerase [Deltaproteobacteria bacterium]
MTEIKICGITNLDDALAAYESGANALGFIFYPKSPRYVSPEKAKEIIENIPGEITRVGVFVNHRADEIKEIVEFCSLNLVQLHGNETPEYCRQFPVSILIKAFSPRTGSDLQTLKEYPVRAILVDTHDPKLYGGTGGKSNWGLASKIRESHPLILSGGLNIDNIMEAIETVHPNAVDINSGVETSPGKKDHNKIRKIIEVARQSNQGTDGREAALFNDRVNF